MADEKSNRNAEIFDDWWHGETEVLLANTYGLSQQVIHRIVLRQIKNRKLALHTYTKRFRNEFGFKTRSPQNMADLRELVIKEYGLEDK